MNESHFAISETESSIVTVRDSIHYRLKRAVAPSAGRTVVAAANR